MRGPVLALSAALVACWDAGPPRPVATTTDGEVAPLDVDRPDPRLAWRLQASGPGARQSAFEVVVRREEDGASVWATGPVRDAATSIAYGGAPLAPDTAHTWQVRIADASGRWSAFSAPARFETSLDGSAWTAAWIGQDGPRPGLSVVASPSPLLRRSFALPALPVVRARLRACGLGLHELHVNGARLGDQVLEPAFTDYSRRVLYETYDVTPLLRPGENTVGVALGRGLYASSGQDGYGWAHAGWNAPPALLLQLDVELADGTAVRVASDATWRVAEGPSRADALRSGEVFDARAEPAGWASPGFDDSAWALADVLEGPRGALRAQTGPPVRAGEPFAPVASSRPAPGVIVHDLGRTVAGWARLAVRGARGTTVSLRYGEKLLPDGTVDATVMYGRPQEDAYTLAGGGEERWEPRFAYHGFRYVELRGDPALPEVLGLEGREVHADLASTGSFSSASPLLDALVEMQRRTLRSNLLWVPTDGAQHEKAPWTADGYLASGSALRLLDSAAFWERWLEDFRDAAADDGGLPVLVPSPGAGPFATYRDDPLWSGSYVLLVADLHRERGDPGLIRRHHDPLRRWLDRMAAQVAATGDLFTGHTFGDWANPGAGSDDVLLASAALAHEARTFARLCRTLGHGDEAVPYEALAARIAAAVNARAFDPARGVYQDPGQPYRQTTNLAMVAWGIAPLRHVQAVVDGVAADVRARGEHLATGAIGTRLLLPVLTDHGHGELALRVALQETEPGWGHWRTLGADTMWEAWGAGARSHSHAFLGTVVDWLFSHLAGITPGEPGFDVIRIAPFVPARGLERAAASIATRHGPVTVRWQRSGPGGPGLFVEVPANARAEVRVPASLGRPRCGTEFAFLRQEDGEPVYAAGPGPHACSFAR